MATVNLTADQLSAVIGAITAVQTAAPNSDDFFLIVCGAMVYLMQAGFAFLEGGSVRSKNATNSLFRNLLCSFFACIAYWACGYAFAYGVQSNRFIGYSNFACSQLDPAKFSFWFFQFTFAAATVSIFSGAIAERADVWSYFFYSIIIAGLVYPVVTHWTWASNGWLLNLQIGPYTGFQDFAGSAGVHVCGASCALIGAAVLGPRIGRFNSGPRVMMQMYKTQHDDYLDDSIRPHSTPMVILGCYFLLFGFFGFNGGSQLHISQVGDGAAVAVICVNTIISGSFGGVSSLIWTKLFHNHWSLLQIINGGLAGMVAICSGCNAMPTWSAAITGFIAGLVYWCWALLIPKLHIDDPLDTVALHLGAGSWGLMSTALFDVNHGLVYNFNSLGFGGLAVQMIGLLAIVGWSAGICLILLPVLKLFHLFRVSRETELTGIDGVRHKEPAYVFDEKVWLTTSSQHF